MAGRIQDMKDVLISGRRIARELMIFCGCFVFALAMNVFAIIKYKTEWKELLTTLHITVALALVIFVLLGLLRLLVCGLARLFRRKAS
jgi:F0F1-type ATP synthase membrane subunit a